MDQTLQAYVELWSEPDADRREALVRACLGEDAEIIGQGTGSRGVGPCWTKWPVFCAPTRAFVPY